MNKAYKAGFIAAFILLAVAMVILSMRSEPAPAGSGESTEVSRGVSPENIPGVVLEDRPVSPVRTSAIRTDALSDVRPQEDSASPSPDTVVNKPASPKPVSQEDQLYKLAESLGQVDTPAVDNTIRSQPLPVPAKPQENKPPVVDTPKVAKKPHSYTVETGDTLSSISEYYYGTPARWKDIQTANNIKDPSKIYPGQKLIIP